MDFYEILGIDHAADTPTVHAAFRTRAQAQRRRLNPDPRTMALLSRAYMVLSNERTRKAYDAKLAPNPREQLRRAAQRSLFDPQ
ncbi:MAG TPA: DnaJ domain-containing protein [Candidatus Saccharimonadia bacterium]